MLSFIQPFSAQVVQPLSSMAMAVVRSVVVDLLFNVLPIVCGSSVFVFVLLCINCVHSSFAGRES